MAVLAVLMRCRALRRENPGGWFRSGIGPDDPGLNGRVPGHDVICDHFVTFAGVPGESLPEVPE